MLKVFCLFSSTKNRRENGGGERGVTCQCGAVEPRRSIADDVAESAGGEHEKRVGA